MLASDCTLIIPAHTVDIYQLHIHRLAAKSLLLRGIFSGASPLDLSPSTPPNRLPRLLQSPPHTIFVFLPVPDPSSIQLLFHWMYSGSTAHLELALHHGHVQWQGIARNVEYLGLPTDIKVFLGRWYRDWFMPASEERDTDESDLDSEDGYCTDDDLQSDVDGDRGRSRDVKPLVQLCARLRLCTT